MRDAGFAPMALTRRNCLAPCRAHSRASAVTYPRSTLRNASWDPAFFIVVPRQQNTSSTFGASRSATWEQGAGRSRRRLVGLTLAYVAGLALFYALLGAIAGASGQLFGTISANPWVRFAVANLLLLFGLAMLDVFPIQAPQRLVAWAARLTGGSYPAVFLLGATSGIVAAPCGAPAFAVVLTWVAATQSAVAG